ncbi:DUF3667 domain-containing protein [Pedobacter frigiditerrae]|uniref:DUF3667 domain-containing protein n=1 Tax=Pedobacter frigiditerrae TaxID=2530452 RepID=UPI00292F933A|nr:DUF3667 domain-containing protein [Pedobacter frigiditerrae]
MTNCKNCNFQIEHNYCAQCGHAAQLKQIDKHYISHEIQHLIHFEKGIFFTIKELFIRPGETVRIFLREDRTKHMKPIAFLAITTVLLSLIGRYFNPEPKGLPLYWPYTNSYVKAIENWFGSHINYNYLSISFFAAAWVKLFFRKHNYSFYEIITLMCFLAGEMFVFYIFLIPFYNIFNYYALQSLAFIIAWFYPALAIGQFFNEKKIQNYIKGFFGVFLGYTTASVIKIVIGLIIYYAITFF